MESLHTNIPYGFSGTILKSGSYTICDIQLLKIDSKLNDGIWYNPETDNTICILTTGLGYFNVFNKTNEKKWKGGVESKLIITNSDTVLFGTDVSYTFNSTIPIEIIANEIYGTLKIKCDEDIVVTYEDPCSDNEVD